MMRWLDKLNLRPQERRLVIFVIVVVFVALNWFFVKPWFGELGRLKKAAKTADDNIARFQAEIQKKGVYEKQIKQLSSEGGQVATADMATSLSRDLNTQAGMAGVSIQSLSPAAPSSHDVRTNSMFEEQTATLTFVNTGEAELINFLFGLASQKSLIRVKSMVLRPDPGHMKLGGTLTLVESFQKKAPSKSAATPIAAKPAVTTAPPSPTATTTAKPGVSAPATNKPGPGAKPGATNNLKKPLLPASKDKKT